MSARKVRVVADLVRGKDVASAIVTLAHQPRAAAEPLKRLLDSAVANAADRGMNVDKLVVSEILVHKGAIGRRFMPRAQGRATPIRKQTAHIDVSVLEAF
jgi:large subunit ribosomal protein L22